MFFAIRNIELFSKFVKDFFQFLKYKKLIILIQYKLNKKYQIIQEVISKNNSFVLVCHVNPDGDAVGSTLAFYQLLITLNKKVEIVVPNDFPDFLKWLPNANDAVVAHNEPEKAAKIIKDTDVLIMLDFNVPKRVDNLQHDIESTLAYKILFDHHLEPEPFVDCIVSDISVSSTCELVFDFISNIYGNEIVTKKMAYCLYTGLLTDTGNFSYSITAKTHIAAATLINVGINPIDVIHQIYDNYSENRTRLLGHCLSDNMVIMRECGAAYIFLSKDDLTRFEYQDGDTEGIVNYPLSIKGICVSAMFIEKDDKIKISLRSKGNFSVNELSRKYFNGGGHKNAAGGHLKVPLKEALVFYESKIIENKEEIIKSCI